MAHTLLLADDSVTIQRVIELTFADEDIRVVAVGDGQQAIDRIAAEPPDIVLADTGMPERDGYDVAMFIKQDPALAHIPVVLLTGAFEPVDGDRAREAGCDAVMVKPFEPQLVISRVKELLGTRTATPPASAASDDVAPVVEPEASTPTGPPTPTGPVYDPEETEELARPLTASRTAPGSDASDDPLDQYLDQIDEAFDRLQAEQPGGELPAIPEIPEVVVDEAAPDERGAPAESAPPTVDSLEGALSALEGALETLSLDPSPSPAAAEDQGTTPAGEDLPAAPPSRESAPEPVDPEPEPPRAEPAVDVLEPIEVVPIEATAPVSADRDDEAEAATEAADLDDAAVDAMVDALVEPSSLSEPAITLTETSVEPPSESAAVEPPPVVSSVPDVETPPASAPRPPVAAPPVSPPSLADAFASLLAAERGEPASTPPVRAWSAAPPASIDDDLVERVTERVLARLSDRVTNELVTQVVTRVTEELVRSELDKLKS